MLKILQNKLIQTTLSLYLLAQTGCGFLTLHVPQDSKYKGPQSVPLSLEQTFDYTASEQLKGTKIVIEETETHLFYTREECSFETYDKYTNKETKIVFEYYKTKLTEKPPLVLVSPILGGAYVIEKPICQLLAENGISALLVHRQKDIFKPGNYQNLESALKSIIANRRKALDQIIANNEVDVEKIGTFGISMGAITNVPLIAIDKRLKYHILGLAGGDIPDIMLHSTEHNIKEFIEEYKQKFGKKQLFEHFNYDYTSDPLIVASYVDARNVRMFAGLFDTIVPFKNCLKLYYKIGQPEINVLPTGHYTTVFYYFWIRDMTLDFFQEKFNTDKKAIQGKKNELRRYISLRRKVS